MDPRKLLPIVMIRMRPIVRLPARRVCPEVIPFWEIGDWIPKQKGVL